MFHSHVNYPCGGSQTYQMTVSLDIQITELIDSAPYIEEALEESVKRYGKKKEGVSPMAITDAPHNKKETNYVNLHVHSVFSFLDGANKIKDCVARVKELGMNAVALTDHNHIGGAVDFFNECEKQGIKPILGCEVYHSQDIDILSLSADKRTQWAINKAEAAGVSIPTHVEETTATGKTKRRPVKKSEIADLLRPFEYPTKQYHMIFLAMNQKGWHNLVELQSEAARLCTYDGNFTTDDALIEQYNEGLIFSTACIGNRAAQLIKQGKEHEALTQIQNWHRIFGDRMYLEIQPYMAKEQMEVNRLYMSWSKELGIPLIATNDVHYTRKEDHDDHDTLLCIGTGRSKSMMERMHYSNEFWIRSFDEMMEAFALQADTFLMASENRDLYLQNCRQALLETNKVAARIEAVKVGSDKAMFPNVTAPNGISQETWLEVKCWANLHKYLAKHPEYDRTRYEEQLAYELGIVNRKGFAPYMHIVEEYVTWANENGCPTGPGRGSAAGSLILFLLGITKQIDPIQNELLFFRFLTEDRKDPPDWKQAA